MLDWLRLLRVTGLTTIAANLIAVTVIAFYAGGGLDPAWLAARLWREGWTVWCVPLASAMLLCAGMLWNDLCDLDRDRALNPGRPLPAGRIGLVPAYLAGIVFAIGAPLIVAQIQYGLHLAGVVLMLALVYNLGAKSVPWFGSLVMALVRASHAMFALLWLGPDYVRMAVTPWMNPPGTAPFIYPAILGLYIFGLTLISELESRPGTRFTYLVGTLCLFGAVLWGVVGLFHAPWLPVLIHGGGMRSVAAVLALGLALTIAVGLIWTIGRPWLAAVRSARRAQVPPVVISALGGMILLDALLAAAAHPLAPLAILPLYPLFLIVGRAIRMN